MAPSTRARHLHSALASRGHGGGMAGSESKTHCESSGIGTPPSKGANRTWQTPQIQITRAPVDSRPRSLLLLMRGSYTCPSHRPTCPPDLLFTPGSRDCVQIFAQAPFPLTHLILWCEPPGSGRRSTALAGIRFPKRISCACAPLSRSARQEWSKRGWGLPLY